MRSGAIVAGRRSRFVMSSFLLCALVLVRPQTLCAELGASGGGLSREPVVVAQAARKPPGRAARKTTAPRPPDLGKYDYYQYEHKIKRGETVIGIAKQYGVSPEKLLGFNDLASPHLIRAGQVLTIYSKKLLRQVEPGEYVVKPGDTLGSIAERHQMPLSRLRKLNRTRGDRIRPGLRLAVETPRVPPIARLGGSRRTTGYLKNAVQLTSERGFRVRNRSRAWGTPNTVRQIRLAFRALRGRLGDSTLLIGDLSAKHGGPLRNHRSHQRGLDVDIAIYRKGVNNYPNLEQTTPATIDARRTWALLYQFIRQGQVDMIFIDYSLQRPLYEEARRLGAPKRKLSEWFQYPAGPNSRRGVIRHEPGHAGHIHVRFLDFEPKRASGKGSRGGHGRPR